MNIKNEVELYFDSYLVSPFVDVVHKTYKKRR